MEDIKTLLAVVTVAISALWGYFRLHARMDTVETCQLEIKSYQAEVEDTLDQLKEDRTVMRVTLENLDERQRDMKQSLKDISDNIAIIARTLPRDTDC